jgi:VCBS repeat-containing protein
MAVRHTYATADDLRDYLAGTSYSSGWTSDAVAIRRILEASSRRIDDYCGGGSFGPQTQTRYYDIGFGNLRNSPQYLVVVSPDDLANATQAVSVIPLDNWLVSTTTVTAYGATDRASSETLTEGYANDFFLMPYNSSPKTLLKLNEDTAKGLDGGQQTLSILGSWGYTADTVSVTTSDAVGSTTATSISVTSASDLGSAQTILIDSEQLYITAISGNTLTVERGVNGSTAATHSGGATLYRYDYPVLAAQACLDLSKVVFRDRDLGTVGSIGSGEAAITSAEGEIQSVLGTLEQFRAVETSNRVVF